MTYFEGFIVPVPEGNKEEYRKHAQEAAALFQEFGVTRMVEAWGDDVPDGKVTDFKKGQREPGENAIFAGSNSDKAPARGQCQ